MSDPLSNLFASTLEVEALLTLYPTRFTEKLQGIRMKSWTVKYSSADFSANTSIGTLGFETPDTAARYGGEDAGSRLSTAAFLDVYLNADGNFEVQFEIHIGKAVRSSKFIRVLPDSRIPFMLNVAADENDDDYSGTAAVLQAVMVATEPIGLRAVRTFSGEKRFAG